MWNRAVLLLLPLLFISALPGSSRPPNIVIILADDLGWGDLGSYGARFVRTPSLDRMATEGVRFTDFYSSAPVCSPARASLLTGRYPVRTGITRVLVPDSPIGLPYSELTLAELLKKKGYATGIVGKWHLGDRPAFLPQRHGFDEYFGIPYSNDMRPLRFIEGDRILKKPLPLSARLTRRFTERAVDFIVEHQARPFFLYLSHAMPHYPIGATHPWRGGSRDGLYGDVIEELDWGVGQILKALEETGQLRHTAIFFTSDNGSWRQRSNGPFRGLKKSTWEGGFRVPLLAFYPGVFESGKVVERPSMLFDVFATCLELAGAERPKDRPIDGLSLLGYLKVGSSTDLPVLRSLLFFKGPRVQAVRQGNWKLHVARTPLVAGSPAIPYELYDLEEDPGERNNLAAERPEVIEQLTHALQGALASLPAGVMAKPLNAGGRP